VSIGKISNVFWESAKTISLCHAGA